MNLTTNFTLKEMTTTSTGFDNTPNQTQMLRLRKLALCLEEVRKAVGSRRVRVRSAFRTKEVNTKVKGSPTSSHMAGDAADIQVSGLPVDEVIRLILEAGIKFDQMIEEYHGEISWVHISFDPRLRQQLLIYKDGVYTRVS